MTDPHPTFSWKFHSGEDGSDLLLRRLEVRECAAASPAEESILAWSFRPDQPEGALNRVKYRGQPLKSFTRYRWSVVLEDRAAGTEHSAQSEFTTGALYPQDLHAAWIGRDPHSEKPHYPPSDDSLTVRTRFLPPVSQFRKTFEARPDAPVTRAQLVLSAKGVVEIFLNGQRVGNDELVPGWTDYRHRIQYESYHVADLLHAGEQNTLMAVLGDGWWSGFLGYKPRNQGEHYGIRPELFVQLIIDYADGHREHICTDASWQQTEDGAIRYSDFLMGERYDARMALDARGVPRHPGHTPQWNPAKVMSRDTSLLIAAADDPIRVIKELAPQKNWVTEQGSIIYDFGQNLVGRVALDLQGLTSGQEIQIFHAEALRDRNTLYRENLRTAESQDRYISAGEEQETYTPRFTFHGFRFIEITGLDPEQVSVTPMAQVLRSGFADTGSFACGHPLVEKIHSNISWGLNGNFVGLPTDCPQRDERLGWLADAQVFTPTALALADVSTFLRRWLKDVNLAQDTEGAFPNWAPVVGEQQPGAPAWGDGGCIIPWEIYRHTGDPAVLHDCWPHMKSWVDYIHRHNPGLLWDKAVGNHYGDWLEVDAETPKELVSTAYFWRSADILARTAEVRGDVSSAEHYAELARGIRRRFQEEFLSADGNVRGETQTGYLLALAWELAEPDAQEAIFGRLVENLEGRGKRLTTGFIGVSLVLPVLARYGRSDLAVDVLLQEEYPSWGYTIRNGATTIWERWDGYTEEHGFQSANMNSFNHYSLGSIGQWLYSGLCGIQQAEGSSGWDRCVIAPVLDTRIGHASGTIETPHGPLSSSWEIDEGRVLMTITVPPGATGELRLDGATALEILGRDDDPKGPETHGEALRLPSGRHQLRAALTHSQHAKGGKE